MGQTLQEKIQVILDSIDNIITVQKTTQEQREALNDCAQRLSQAQTRNEFKRVLTYIVEHKSQAGYSNVEHSLRRALNIWD